MDSNTTVALVQARFEAVPFQWCLLHLLAMPLFLINSASEADNSIGAPLVALSLPGNCGNLRWPTWSLNLESASIVSWCIGLPLSGILFLDADATLFFVASLS